MKHRPQINSEKFYKIYHKGALPESKRLGSMKMRMEIEQKNTMFPRRHLEKSE